MKTTGYSFVAAANLFKSFGGLQMYVKYKAGPNQIRLKHRARNHLWFECPDREIVLVRNAYKEDAFYPWGHSFDVAIDCSTFTDDVCEAEGVDYVMTNFVHSSEDNHRGDLKKPSITVMSDSGGLQMSRGLANPINPVELAKYYDANVDAGMCVDLPTTSTNPDFLRRLARLQKRNNELMLATAKRAEIINIFHGNTPEQRKMFRDIVETDKIERVALGGLWRQYPLTAANTMLEFVNVGRRYKHYHALGVFMLEYLPLLVKIANSGWGPHITSDATSHVQGSVNGSYFHQRDAYHPMQRHPIGTNYMKMRSTFRHLPCHCRVCRHIKYMDVLAFMDNRFAPFLALHNAVAMSAYTKQLEEAVLTLSHTEFKAMLARQLQRNPMLSEMLTGLDFIDVALGSSLRTAQKRYESHIGSWKSTKQVPTGLFDGGQGAPDPLGEGQLSATVQKLEKAAGLTATTTRKAKNA